MGTGFVNRWKGKQDFPHDGLWVGGLNPVPDTAVVPAGTTAAGAYALTSVDNVIAGTVGAGTGVILANLKPGMKQRVWARTGTTATKVYAQGTTTIDGTAGSTGVSMTAPKGSEFFCESTGVIVSSILGTTSS
jgi:hypothetical protein